MAARTGLQPCVQNTNGSFVRKGIRTKACEELSDGVASKASPKTIHGAFIVTWRVRLLTWNGQDSICQLIVIDGV